MKTRLTNKYLEFVEHIQGELSNPFSAGSCVVFSVFPALGTGHFSIQVVDATNPFILVRQWNQDLADSYQLGICNLDNVKIEERKLSLSDKDLIIVRDLVHSDKKVKETEAIILDGVDFELKVARENKTDIYHWRTEEQISDKTKTLIKKLIDVAGLQQKL